MKIIHFFLLLSTLLYTISTTFVVQSPTELSKILQQRHPDGIPYSVANYGDVPFGKSMSGTIVIGSYLQNCIYDPLSDEDKRKHNKVVLSARGDCSFTQKSINSQKQGAKLAIIADNVDTENPGRVILADDGRGSQVHIPTVFIQKQLGQTIHDYILNKNKTVNIMVKFQTHKKPKADVTLWLSSFDRRSYILVRQLDPYFKRISDFVNLKVRHVTYYCSSCLETDCFNSNKYCVNVDYWGFLIQNFGRTIIKQQLREQIMLQQTSNDQNFHEKWWKYMERYDDQCVDKYSLENCSISAMKAVGIDPERINTILEKSFVELEVQNKTDYDNKRLQSNWEEKIISGIVFEPAVVVNNIQFRGNLEADQIFALTCQSIEQKPQGCNLQVTEKPSVWKYVIIGLILFASFMAFLMCCYRRIVRREATRNMNKQVNELVNEYITMYEAKKFEDERKPSSASQQA